MAYPLQWSFDRRCLASTAGETVARRASDLLGVFVDEERRSELAATEDPVVYRVTAVERAGGGDLSWGLGVIEAGCIGDEYFMTKGHAHARREAAEVYVGLHGEGLMLLEDLRDGAFQAVPLRADEVVYVPGFTAHRTVNVGSEPLGYLGIYPSDAGHDYEVVRLRNFAQVVLAGPNGPRVVLRDELGRGT